MRKEALLASGVACAALAVALAFSHPSLDSYDAWIMLQVSHSMVADHSFRVMHDFLGLNQPFASYGIGTSLLWTPAVWLAPLLRRPPESLAMLVNPFLFCLIVAAVYGWMRTAGGSAAQSVVVALVIGFATPLLPYAVSGFSEIGVALGLTVALWASTATSRWPLCASGAAGLAAGFAVLMRQDSLILVAPIVGALAVVMSARRATALLGFVAGLAPALAITGGYNFARFGSPLVSQYQTMPLSRAFNHPFLVGLTGLLVSPGRGLLLFAPVVVLAAVGVPWAWRRSPAVCIACLALLGARLVVYSPWWAWDGGAVWGPRFLVPAMPAMAPMLLEVTRHLQLRSLASPAAAAVVLLSSAVQVLGTGIGYDPNVVARANATAAVSDFAATATIPANEQTRDSVDFAWDQCPITSHARQLAQGHLTGRLPELIARRTQRL
jgi:hypothetical protein